MIDKHIQTYDEKSKNLERLINIVKVKHASLLDTLNKAKMTMDGLNRYMTDLNSEKRKIKTDLQVYLPPKLDTDFQKIINELDVSIKETSKHLTSISMKIESRFQKKLEQHLKNRKNLEQDSKKDLEDAINIAN